MVRPGNMKETSTDKWILHKGSVHWDELSNSLSNWKNILSYNSVAMKKAELNQKFKLIKSKKK